VAETVSVEGDELGILSQQAIQSWLVKGSGTDPPGMNNLPSRHPAVLYTFLEYLSRCLLKRMQDWSPLPAPLDGLDKRVLPSTRRLQTLTPNGIYRVLRAGFTGLQSWPNGLFKFLDAYCGCPPLNDEQRLHSFRRDWFQASWKNPSFEFLRQGYVNYLLARNLPIPVLLAERYQHVAWFSELTGLWSEEQTAQTLSVPLEKLHYSLSYGSMAACRWLSSRKTAPLFERNKVLTLLRKWSLGWSILEASSWLGLEKTDVIELVKRGELILVGKPDEDEIHWTLSRRSVEGFFEKVVARLELFQGDHRDLACLWEAVHETSYLGMDPVTLLQGVTEGFLPAYKRNPEILSLEHTCFLKNSVWHLPDLCYARHGWISGYAFASEKGFLPRIVVEWVNEGLIKPQKVFGRHMFFDRQDLEELAIKYIPRLGQSHYL
jgi:hypothetical protein